MSPGLYSFSSPPPQPEPKRVLRTVTVVGEAPNAQGLSRYDTQTGKRIREWAGRELTWWNVYDVLPERWRPQDARYRVIDHMRTYVLGSEPYLLLGRKVCAAFGLPPDAEWLGWYRSAEHRHPMVVLPHPSPLNRWYNGPGNRERAADLVRLLARGDLPRYERGVEDE